MSLYGNADDQKKRQRYQRNMMPRKRITDEHSVTHNGEHVHSDMSRKDAGHAGHAEDAGRVGDDGNDKSRDSAAMQPVLNHASTDETLNMSARPPRKRSHRGGVITVIVIAIITALSVGAQRYQSAGDLALTGSGRADTLTIGLKLPPNNLDIRNQSGSALDQVLIGNVYEGLVARASDNTVKPALAASWDSSADGKTYIFHLNEHMHFSNGHVLDASDVAWSINELVDKQYQDAAQLRNFKSIRALDANTVELDLTAPYADLLWVLTGRAGLIFDKDANFDMKTQAIGSGPYVVSKFVANSSVTFTANPRYWGKHAAQTKTVIIRYFADDNAAVNALKSSDVQVLAPVSENLATPFIKDPSRYVVQAGDDTDKYVLAFNCRGEKTADIRVRQAIRYAINHKELIASRGGADSALGGPIPSLDPGYEDLTGLYPHNLTKAKALMKQAGYSVDKPLKLSLTYANTYGTELGEQLRSQLKPIGIALNVHVVEFSTWLQDVYTNKNFELSLVDHNESHDFYQWADPDYYYGYDSKDVQGLYAKAMGATNDSEEAHYLALAARKVSQDAPADWLFNYRITTAYVKGVEGFPLNLNQTLLPLYDVTYTPATSGAAAQSSAQTQSDITTLSDAQARSDAVTSGVARAETLSSNVELSSRDR